MTTADWVLSGVLLFGLFSISWVLEQIRDRLDKIVTILNRIRVNDHRDGI